MELYSHQQKIISIAEDKYLLPHSCGTGKTITSLEIMKKKKVKSVLIICVKSIVGMWEKEILNYKPIKFEIITKEYLRMHWQELSEYRGVIWDEIHYASSIKSGIHKATINYLKKWNVKYVIGATSTPFLSTPWNIYALARILGRNWNYIKFRNHFFNAIQMGRRLIWLPKKNIEKEIAKLVNNLGETIKLKDCIEMPPQIFQQEYFTLTVEQKRAIKEVKEDAELPLVQNIKIHQIENGTLKNDGYTENRFFKSEKLKRLLEIISEHKKIAIFFKYKLEIEMVAKSIKNRKVFIISGDVQNRDEVVKQIEKENDAVALIMEQVSCGYELPTIDFIVYYTMNFSFVDYEQSRGRFMRINKPTKNVYLFLLNEKDSIDYAVYDNVVNQKKNFQVEIYNNK